MILETNVKGLAVWTVLAAAMLAVGCGAARVCPSSLGTCRFTPS